MELFRVHQFSKMKPVADEALDTKDKPIAKIMQKKRENLFKYRPDLSE